MTPADYWPRWGFGKKKTAGGTAVNKEAIVQTTCRKNNTGAAVWQAPTMTEDRAAELYRAQLGEAPWSGAFTVTEMTAGYPALHFRSFADWRDFNVKAGHLSIKETVE